MTLYEPPLSFTHEDRKYLPNCSMDKFEYAYLNMTNIGGKIDYVSNIKERQNSEQILYKDERVIFYDNLNETNFTLNCIYYTPDGIITLKKSFIFVDKKVVAQNYSKDHMYKESHDKKLEYYNEKGFIEAEVNDDIFEEDEHHKHKKTVTFALIMVVFLFIISFNMYLLYHLKIRNKIIKYRKIKMIRQQYSNILTFWSQIKEMELFKEYCKNILNDDYLSSKGKNIRWNTMYAYDDEVVKYDDCTFKDTLVSCYTESETKIVANYVASSKRNYILSDPPNKENIDDFFKMIFIENVRVVVAIIYKNQSESYNKVFLEKMYWPTEKKSFKDIVIEPIKSYDFKESSIFGFEYRMTKDSTVRNFLILHAFNWREYEIPSSKVHFLNLYNEANTYAGDENILLHSSQGGTSRIFLFIYFACIYENMIYGDMISDPMNVIYNVRESRYGGSLDIKEYGFLLNALVTIFFKENYLYDTIDSVANFDKYYEEFMKEYYYIISLAPKKLVQLVMFLNVINEEKVNELWIQSSRKHIYYDKDLDSKCKRYNNTPIKETIDDMLDMIYRNNIGVVVLLLSHQETFESKSTWFPYFPVKDYMLSSDTYYIVKKPLTYKIKDIILVNEYGIVNKENSTKDFKIIHFIKWPDAGFPDNISDINELYECLTKEKQNRNIAIHCGSGIGRTGTFALIMLMINTLETSGVFDPYKSLEVIRRHRFRAVQTLNQFIFAIGVVVEHYKESLGKENSDAIYKFKKLIDKFC
uniref:Tyrosine-protein phosphatase domain-containing protein n=1 Tax=Parastrongyloides trichosuri TaxID=131310 RepID=A0A0N4ZF89_PARTI